MIIHRAEPQEAETLREAWGDTVASATFWDADFPEEAIEAFGSRWELAEGFRADGESLGQIFPSQGRWRLLEGMLRGRGETVKFGLAIR